MSMAERYSYLFPFEKIPYGSSILIYGAGTLGHEYLEQIRLTGYCRVVGVIDRNANMYVKSELPVYKPENIKELNFDYVVVAIRIDTHKSEIFKNLKNNGVEDSKIVCIFERNTEGLTTGLEGGTITTDANEAYRQTRYSIAVCLTGGIGDNIIQKRFIMELASLIPEALIDIYSLQNKEFKIFLFSDMDRVNRVYDDLGYLYEKEKSNYTLSIFVEACSFIRIDTWKRSVYENAQNAFAEVIDRIIARSMKEKIDITTPTMISIKRKLYNGLNAFTGIAYGLLDLSDKKVSIPITNGGIAFFDKLEIGNERYCSVNCGNGVCTGGQSIAKSWPKERFEEVIAKIKKKHNNIRVVQLGEEKGVLLKGADLHLMGESFENIAPVLQNASFHLDIEGGLVHMAYQLGTRCIVLFGPTSMDFYAYESNVNVRRGNCLECAGLYTDAGACARSMEQPECMYGIDVTTVLKSVDKILLENQED